MKRFHAISDRFEPDICFVWDSKGLPTALLRHVSSNSAFLPVFYLADYTPSYPDPYQVYWEGESDKAGWSWLKKRLASRALAQLQSENSFLIRYEHCLCVSRFVRERLVVGGFISPNAKVVYNGINLEHFFSRINPDDSKREKKFLVAGRLTPEKGLLTVIKAFRQFLDREDSHLRHRLDVMGDGSSLYLDLLKTAARKLELSERVHFSKAVPRESIPRKLNESDIFVLASEWDEPLARSIQEAMAAGRVVVASDSGGTRELVESGKTGFLFEPGNVESLTEAMIKAVSADSLQIGLAAQEVIRSRFDLNRTIQEIEDYLAGLLK